MRARCAECSFRLMKMQTGVVKWQSAERQNPFYLTLKIIYHVLVVNPQNETRQYRIPMRHQLSVLLVIAADLGQSVRNLLSFTPQLLVATEAAGHGVTPRVDNFGIGENEFD